MMSQENQRKYNIFLNVFLENCLRIEIDIDELFVIVFVLKTMMMNNIDTSVIDMFMLYYLSKYDLLEM